MKSLLALLLVFGAAFAPEPSSKADSQLWEYRNLGKAFYENPDTHPQAVDALHHALELAPDSVREHINYGLALLRAGKNAEAIAQLQIAQKQDPSLPYTWFNLGIYYKRAGDYDKALEQLQQMVKLVPNEPISHYNLAAVMKAKGDVDAAVTEFAAAEKLNPYLAGPHFQLFTIYQRQQKHDLAVQERKQFEEAKKRNEGAAVPEDMEWCFYAELYDPPDPRPYPAVSEPTKYEDRVLSRDWPAGTRLLTIDSTGSGSADLIAYSKDRIELYHNAATPVQDSGLSGLHGIRYIAAGDYDNNGLTDLVILTDSGASLWHNEKGKFSKRIDLPNTAGATVAVWLDYDHDYDLDLFLFGPTSKLMRNNGNGTFEDKSEGFPFVNGQALNAATYAFRGDTAARDLVVSYADHPAVLYRDKLNENFEHVDIPQLPAGSDLLSVQDINHDGLLDIVSYAPKPTAVQSNGDTFASVSADTIEKSSLAADFNGDFRQDFAQIGSDGALHVFLNASPAQRWSTVLIKGIKNIKLAPGATVEMKSGAYYDKQIYAGLPLSFALDSRADADTIRITWPNGLIQNEVHQKANAALKIEEAQRLSGSCPMIFTWDGTKFRFITDVLGVAPLGASSGDGHYFPVDHDEYIQIPGDALKSQNGLYRVNITEELHEVSYLDKVQLIAVDHPADIDFYTNDKFKSPPYPEFHLFGSSRPIHPIRAIDNGGPDVREALARIDHRYPTNFHHTESGVAELHTLDLDFGNVSGNAQLVLNGWVDWADGSTFLAASQGSKDGLIFPYLQVKNARGEWQTVVQDMGIPSGKPKTIVVDLAGKFLSNSREVRIVTNLCVYWDEAFLIENGASPNVRLTPVTANAALLGFRGFSQVVVDPQRQQPEQFLYSNVRMLTNWNPTPGMYTRYGDVRPLVTDIDDRMVIMGSGDQLELTFPANNLPPLRPGWKRDFLLLVDGWAKDADANTAYSQSVTPLPFHAMSAYPYGANEHFPADAAHRQYIDQYLTRPALKLIRPLVSSTR